MKQQSKLKNRILGGTILSVFFIVGLGLLGINFLYLIGVIILIPVFFVLFGWSVLMLIYGE